MVLQLELAALATLIVTILAGIVSVTRYITQLQLRVRQERLEAENESLKKQYTTLEARYKALIDEIAISRRIGTAALIKKKVIEDELLSIMEFMQASAGSIYIPLFAESSPGAVGLAFLAIEPLGPQALALRKKPIPLTSLAGRCFTTGQPFVTSDSKSNPYHWRVADEISGYRTEDTLNFPLRHQGKTVGVLQLLNKKGGTRFEPADLERVELFVASLSSKVADFISIPDHLEILGITPEREARYAAVMFCDLTNSSVLFQEMDAAAAIRHINEYLEAICEIAFSHRATVDTYLGDGVMFRFNVPLPMQDPPIEAIKAALEMQAAFERLKSQWAAMGELVGSVYSRIGIAYGPVYLATVGHPQHQNQTIFGACVNIAANLCESAVRHKNTIVIDGATYKWLSDKELFKKLLVKPVPKERLGKAAIFIEFAYEIESSF